MLLAVGHHLYVTLRLVLVLVLILPGLSLAFSNVSFQCIDQDLS
jgi:hypothetical protein